MFSYKFCEISKNTSFTEHLRTTASIRCRSWFQQNNDCNEYRSWSAKYIVNLIVRNSHAEVFCKWGVFKNFYVHRKTPLLESLFDKLSDWRSTPKFKKRLRLRWFYVNFEKLLMRSILKNLCKWLLLYKIFRLPFVFRLFSNI